LPLVEINRSYHVLGYDITSRSSMPTTKSYGIAYTFTSLIL